METGILEDLGLSKRESKTYLVLLGLGTSTIGDIVKRTEIPSSKIYEVLDRLMAKGLVSYVVKKNQKHYQASEPEAILNYINERKKKFEDLLPELKSKQKMAKDRQEVELYEGMQAVSKLIHRLVEEAHEGDEYLSFSLAEEHSDPEVVRFFTNLAWRRKEKGLKIRVIINDRIKEIMQRSYPKEVLKAVNIKTTKFNYPQGIVIIGKENLITLNWGERPTAVLMKSKQVVENYRKFFYELFDNAKKFV